MSAISVDSLAVAASELPGPVNVGNPDEMTVRHIAERVVAAVGSSSPIEFVDAVVDDPKVRRPDTTQARELLGWEPQVPSEEGLRRTVAWFAAWLWGLESHSWPHAHAYLTQVPVYLWRVGPNLQPYFFVLPAWSYAAYRAWRGNG